MQTVFKLSWCMKDVRVSRIGNKNAQDLLPIEYLAIVYFQILMLVLSFCSLYLWLLGGLFIQSARLIWGAKSKNDNFFLANLVG